MYFNTSADEEAEEDENGTRKKRWREETRGGWIRRRETLSQTQNYVDMSNLARNWGQRGSRLEDKRWSIKGSACSVPTCTRTDRRNICSNSRCATSYPSTSRDGFRERSLRERERETERPEFREGINTHTYTRGETFEKSTRASVHTLSNLKV